MRVLLFCDDYYHPGEIPTKGTQFLRDKGIVMDIICDATGFDPAVIAGYDVVIMSKCDHISRQNDESWKTPAVQKAFVDFVENGGGLVVTHSGTVRGVKADTSVLNQLVGCYFDYHPARAPITVGPLKPHPVTAGADIFCEVDEHYHLKILAEDIDILAASYADAQGDADKYETAPFHNYPAYMAPCVYVRTQGKGRVCVLTPGHTLEVWHNPNFQKMLENALNWCGGK